MKSYSEKLEELRQLSTQNNFTRTLMNWKYFLLREFIEDNSKFPELNLTSQIFCLLNDFNPYCEKSGKPKRYLSQKDGFTNFCETNCQCAIEFRIEKIKEANRNRSDEEKQELKLKKEKTMLERYGVEYPAQSEEVRQKMKQTSLEHYGTEHPMHNEEVKKHHREKTIENGGFTFQREDSKKKVAETNLERYGHENYFGSEQGKEQIRSVMTERFGVEHPSQSKECLERRETVYLERYGVTNPRFYEEFELKRQQTCIEKYGVPHPFQSQEVKEKSKATSIERYGVEYPTQSPEIRLRQLKSGWRTKEYIWPSGKVSLVQGYEPYAIDQLLAEGYSEEQIEVDNVPTVNYEFNGEKKVYHPDIFIPEENRLIEVKSEFTMQVDFDKNQAKRIGSEQAGFVFEFRIIII